MGLDVRNPDLEVIKLFSNSTQMSMKFILLINVKMSTMLRGSGDSGDSLPLPLF